ncbi:MAG: hypothetical protein N4A72_22125 [Bacteroidales bacterium]|jgi:hypothetical protein|nr:hypothetical protein [Bacteroidales bacterium]
MIFQYHASDSDIEDYFRKQGFEIGRKTIEVPDYQTHSRNEYRSLSVPAVIHDGKFYNAIELFNRIASLRFKSMILSEDFNDKQTINNELTKTLSI